MSFEFELTMFALFFGGDFHQCNLLFFTEHVQASICSNNGALPDTARLPRDFANANTHTRQRPVPAGVHGIADQNDSTVMTLQTIFKLDLSGLLMITCSRYLHKTSAGPVDAGCEDEVAIDNR